MSPTSDAERLRDMVTYAGHAVALLGDHDAAALASDLRTQLAVIRAVEVVGEAATRISGVTREGLPTLPWSAIIGMRNALIHGYPDIDLERVVNVVNHRLPELIAAIERLLTEGETE